MDDYSDINLKKFYQELYDNIIKNKKKIIENSVLLTFLKTKSNDRFRLMASSALPGHKIGKANIESLVSKNLIRETETLNSYVITAKGIWEIETKNNSINEKKLLEYLDGNFFSVHILSEKYLVKKEKVALFAMIAARAFSEKSAVDLKRGETTKNAWESILNKTIEKLKSLGLMPGLVPKEVYGNPGNDHPVSSLFRHIGNDLTKKTKGIYKSPGAQKYWLEVSDGQEISKEKLQYLIKLIMGDVPMSFQTMDELDKFCRTIAHSENIYLFDPKEHLFAKPKYDVAVRDCLLFL